MTTLETQHTVKSVLLDAVRPLTERMIIQRTGLSRNTVRDALTDLGVEPQRIANAHVYSLRQEKRPEALIRWGKNTVLAHTTGGVAAVELLDIQAVPDYNRLVHRIAAALPARLTADTDPADAARALSEYAVVLTTIAAQLQQNQNNPAWFIDLGGEERLEI